MFFHAALQEKYAHEKEHQIWTARELGNARMEVLKNLPRQRMETAEGKRIWLLHARPEDVSEMPILYTGATLTEFLSDYQKEADAVLIGHSHLPLYTVFWDNRPVINPGAVGVGKDGLARYAVIEIDAGRMNVNFRQVKYDLDAVCRDLREKQVPCGERFAKMFWIG